MANVFDQLLGFTREDLERVNWFKLWQYVLKECKYKHDVLGELDGELIFAAILNGICDQLNPPVTEIRDSMIGTKDRRQG